ncbi:hypothetical protein AK973_5234 [Pseudomonas brassicacearum]|nr:hypothetical protein AK973_5234 [Pseudomonas brassicacearum]
MSVINITSNWQQHAAHVEHVTAGAGISWTGMVFMVRSVRQSAAQGCPLIG